MNDKRHFSAYLKRLLGATLLPLGLMLLLVNAEERLAASDSGFPLSLGESGGLPALAIPLFRLIRSYFLDRPGLLHGLSQFLLSCWPILLIITGIALLGGTLASRLETGVGGSEGSNFGARS